MALLNSVKAQIACLLLGFATVSNPAGGTTLLPRPNLSAEEWMEVGVGSADGVVIGWVMAVRDSEVTVRGIRTATMDMTHRTMRAVWTYVDVDIVEILKGDSIPTRISVVVPTYGPSPVDLRAFARGPDRRGIVFLQRRALGWILASEYAPSGGLLPLRDIETPAMRSRIQSLVAAHAPERLASEATLVIAGDLQRRAPCGGRSDDFEGEVGCLVFRVASVIAGVPDAEEIRVSCPVLPPLTFGRAVLFLRESPRGWYTLVGANAGIIPINDRKGAFLRDDVVGLLARIRAAATAAPHRAKQ